MTKKIKIMTIFGTRPEAIKMAPLVKEIERNSEHFESIVTVTAQHREMLDQVLKQFSIQPHHDLNIMKSKQTLAELTSRTITGLQEIIAIAKPDIVLVHGDTTTTFAASLAAYYEKVKIGHVEAGLRTWNKYSPFPEEMNRQLTSKLADLHFAPTTNAKENLLIEGIKEEKIFVTGNTVIDALNTTVDKNYSDINLDSINGRKLILVTAHRRENFGEPLVNVFLAIKEIVENNKDVEVIYPVHLNPSVRESAYNILGNLERIQLIEPLDVLDFHNYAAKAELILTDSGGIQEEAPSLGKPVLVLRETTERPEGVEANTLKLVGTDKRKIIDNVELLLSNKKEYEAMSKASNPYGDGKASKRIMNSIIFAQSNDKESKPLDFIAIK